MDPIRRASVAGTWYPASPAALAADVDRYVGDAGVEPVPGLRAVIAPHAGLMYSGPVAAFAYKAARDARVGTVVLVGPSHFIPFGGASIWRRGAWDTPFGPVPVDEAMADAIVAAAPGEMIERADAHGREHSLEMQLPFIARLMPGVRIVPIVMGQQTRETAMSLGTAIAVAAGARPADVLLVASSDLSHYEPVDTAARMDAVVLRHVEALDPEGLMDALEAEPRHACGGGPIVSVLQAARQLGAAHARVLQYADSGDVSGDKSAVVGYMAAAIW